MDAPRRVLIVANRTRATPTLLSAVKRYGRGEPTTFSLAPQDAGRSERTDWTLEAALPGSERAARGYVAGLTGERLGPRSRRSATSSRRAASTASLCRRCTAPVALAAPGPSPQRVEGPRDPVEVVAPQRQTVRDVVQEATSIGSNAPAGPAPAAVHAGAS